MSSLANSIYCVPWGVIENPPKRKKRNAKKVCKHERIRRVVLGSRGKTRVTQLSNELDIDSEDEILRIVLQDDDLDVWTSAKGALYVAPAAEVKQMEAENHGQRWIEIAEGKP